MNEASLVRHLVLPLDQRADAAIEGYACCLRQPIDTEHVEAGGQALPCLWRRGIVLNIPLVFGRAVRGPTMSLNDHDQVIGSTFRGGVSGVHGFVWQKGRTTDLPLLPGGKSSKAHAINNKGWIVGTSQTSSGAWHAVRSTYKP